jgi:hypothetical protein
LIRSTSHGRPVDIDVHERVVRAIIRIGFGFRIRSVD